jgi:hypothetical protein
MVMTKRHSPEHVVRKLATADRHQHYTGDADRGCAKQPPPTSANFRSQRFSSLANREWQLRPGRGCRRLTFPVRVLLLIAGVGCLLGLIRRLRIIR